MTIVCKPVLFGLTALLILGVGCGRKTNANAELDSAVKALEKSEAAAPAATRAAAAAPPAAPVPVTPASQETVVAQPVSQQMSAATASYKAGDYTDAITRLQLLRTKVTKTPEQTVAVQDAMAAVMSELYARAEKGDARASQAIKLFQEQRNNRR